MYLIKESAGFYKHLPSGSGATPAPTQRPHVSSGSGAHRTSFRREPHPLAALLALQLRDKKTALPPPAWRKPVAARPQQGGMASAAGSRPNGRNGPADPGRGDMSLHAAGDDARWHGHGDQDSDTSVRELLREIDGAGSRKSP